MGQSEDPVILFEHDSSKNIETFSFVIICCICRQEILENEIVVQCPNCQTFYHSNHLSIWLNINSTCPVCRRYFSKKTSSYSKRDSKKSEKKVKK